MNEKLSLYNIAQLLAKKTGIEASNIETFIIELITLINEGIRRDGIVKIKGFGTFKVILVKERESVHINTGERIIIPAHHKLSFKPEERLKELINKPFAIFETIEASDDNLLMDTELTASNDENLHKIDTAFDQSIISDYKILENNNIPDLTGTEKDDIDILPPEDISRSRPVEEKDSEMKDEYNSLSLLGEKKEFNSSQIDENKNNKLETYENKKEELNTSATGNEVFKENKFKKNKSKTSSLTPLYIILFFLLFILAGCIWYYFAYNRSFNSFNKEYNTKVSKDIFVLPGDTVSEQYTREIANILSKDTVRVNNNNDSSHIQMNNAERKKIIEVSKITDQTELKTENTINNKEQSTSVTTSVSKVNEDKVLAKIKMQPGNRLTLVAEKYYGNKIFWVYIYDYNKDKIGPNPNNVKAGAEIIVPAKENYGINANDKNSIEKARKLQSQLISGQN